MLSFNKKYIDKTVKKKSKQTLKQGNAVKTKHFNVLMFVRNLRQGVDIFFFPVCCVSTAGVLGHGRGVVAVFLPLHGREKRSRPQYISGTCLLSL